MKNKGQMSEHFLVGIMLALAGGFLDAYTYLVRGGVFANAQTGNIVLLGTYLAKGTYSKVFLYLVPILAFTIGILISEIVKSKLKLSTKIHWRQLIVIFEIIMLFCVTFIPQNQHNTIVNTVISFVCSLQVESFRKINGHAVATTMCTGNLRSGTEALYLGITQKNKSLILKCFNNYGIILFFIIGAFLGTVITKIYLTYSLFFACAVLIIPLVMMFKTLEK
ncbi:MAG: DUF1275 domain-containing protein [Clostridia bacterium]|nr:DUF1275 domain-containing protein [Clostridia bacterium]